MNKFNLIENKARFDNLIATYNELCCQLEVEHDFFMNNTLWNEILNTFLRKD